MAGIAAAELHAQFGRGQVEFVMEDDDVGGGGLEEARSFADRAAGLVHIGLRQQQQRLFAADRRLAGVSLETAAPGRGVAGAGDRRHGHEADIVAVAGIALAGIAEACEDQHRSVPQRLS